MPAKTQEKYCEALDEQGEKRVRELKAQGSFSDRHLKWVDLWLENKERADEAAAQERQERQEGREEDSLSISCQANKLAETANTHADDANKLAKRSLCIAGVSMVVAFSAALVAIFVD